MEKLNVKLGLKRIAIFASVAWAGYWFFNAILTKSDLFGIDPYDDDYAILGLLGLVCIWVTQFFAYWIFCGFTNEPDELKKNRKILRME